MNSYQFYSYASFSVYLVVEMKYGLGYNSWGQRYAGEIVKCLHEWGSTRLGVTRFIAITIGTNVNSGKVLKRSGYVHLNPQDSVNPDRVRVIIPSDSTLVIIILGLENHHRGPGSSRRARDRRRDSGWEEIYDDIQRMGL